MPPTEDAEPQPTSDRVTSIGEFSLIARIIDRLGDAAASDILVPPGDDAAVWREEAPAVVATIDALTEGNHWRADTMSLADVGWRAVAVNVSDLAAMGAEPAYLLVAASLAPGLPLAELDGFVDGMAEACRVHGVRVAGGDIVRGNATMFTIAAYGRATVTETGEARVLRRDGAAVGDAVAVSGHPGASAAGLALIESGRGDVDAAKPLVRAHRRPSARVELGLAAVAAGIRCAIDVSDGLLQDLDHIAERSGVGIEVDCAAVPVHPAARELLGDETALDLALGGGEDFELVLVGPETALLALDTTGLPVTVIGRVVGEHPGTTVARDIEGKPYAPPRRGWDQLEVAPA